MSFFLSSLFYFCDFGDAEEKDAPSSPPPTASSRRAEKEVMIDVGSQDRLEMRVTNDTSAARIAVVLAPGMPPADLWSPAVTAARLKFASDHRVMCVRFNFRGAGQSTGGEEARQYTSPNTSGYKDVLAVCRWCRSRTSVSLVVVVGVGYGAVQGLWASGEDGSEVDGVVALNCPADLSACAWLATDRCRRAVDGSMVRKLMVYAAVSASVFSLWLSRARTRSALP